MIVIPQDPGPLLDILPNPNLKLNGIIKVVWLSKLAPAFSDLKPFLQVRKEKVLSALQYLVQHNHLYHDLTINHDMIDSWDSDFIPPKIEANIIHITDSDHREREGYYIPLSCRLAIMKMIFRPPKAVLSKLDEAPLITPFTQILMENGRILMPGWLMPY
jgi:uncharacterized protein DUF6570